MSGKFELNLLWQVVIWILLVTFFAIPINYYVSRSLDHLADRCVSRTYCILPRG
ncbi:MAG: hypothetical protein ACE14T_02045 [Syntrophales bacterium]